MVWREGALAGDESALMTVAACDLVDISPKSHGVLAGTREEDMQIELPGDCCP
ncbi:MAG: hypothetical protein IT300_10395 [Dehalococcoidia bacterium]|jgi:hypothetical protein|nr:hypothetical protein [Dehalococcoidia bacterium]